MQSFFRSTFAIGTIGLIVFVSLMSGCSQTSEDSPAVNAASAQKVCSQYCEIIEDLYLGATQVFSSSNHYTRSSENRTTYFSKEDLEFLSSLSELEFKDMYGYILRACGGVERIESIQDEN